MKKKIKTPKADIKRGTLHEMEHTKSKKVARKIAMDHEQEHPLYYDRKVGLPAFEKRLTKIERRRIKKR